MNDTLNMPITVARAEFISNLTKLINESSLPPFIIEPILKDMYVEIKDIAQKQYELDKAKYEQSRHKHLEKEDEVV